MATYQVVCSMRQHQRKTPSRVHASCIRPLDLQVLALRHVVVGVAVVGVSIDVVAVGDTVVAVSFIVVAVGVDLSH